MCVLGQEAYRVDVLDCKSKEGGSNPSLTLIDNYFLLKKVS